MPYDLTVPGWMSEPDLKIIEKLAQRIPAHGSMVEVGAFLGRSATAWAMSAHPTVAITCMDLWQDVGWFEHAQWGETPLVPRGNLSKYNGSYKDTFMENMKGFPNVLGVQGNSRDENDFWNLDLVFLDGDHKNGIRYDIENWIKRLKPNGLLCGHDFSVAPRLHQVASSVITYSLENDYHIFSPARSSIWLFAKNLSHLGRWWPNPP